MELTYKDVRDILKIIDEAQHLDEIDLVYGGFRLHVVRNGAGADRPAAIVADAHVVAQASERVVPDAPRPTAPDAACPARPVVVPKGMVTVDAPMLGTFYRSPAPGEKPFVEEGQHVCADDTVCLIEVMKLFNSIRAGVDGQVAKILPENGSLVEFEQPLMFIAPTVKG